MFFHWISLSEKDARFIIIFLQFEEDIWYKIQDSKFYKNLKSFYLMLFLYKLFSMSLFSYLRLLRIYDMIKKKWKCNDTILEDTQMNAVLYYRKDYKLR